jgi:hypothetical protein
VNPNENGMTVNVKMKWMCVELMISVAVVNNETNWVEGGEPSNVLLRKQLNLILSGTHDVRDLTGISPF